MLSLLYRFASVLYTSVNIYTHSRGYEQGWRADVYLAGSENSGTTPSPRPQRVPEATHRVDRIDDDATSRAKWKYCRHFRQRAPRVDVKMSKRSLLDSLIPKKLSIEIQYLYQSLTNWPSYLFKSKWNSEDIGEFGNLCGSHRNQADLVAGQRWMRAGKRCFASACRCGNGVMDKVERRGEGERASVKGLAGLELEGGLVNCSV